MGLGLHPAFMLMNPLVVVNLPDSRLKEIPACFTGKDLQERYFSSANSKLPTIFSKIISG